MVTWAGKGWMVTSIHLLEPWLSCVRIGGTILACVDMERSEMTGEGEVSKQVSKVTQPTRLHPPWDSPGKSTGVGCHFLLQGIFPTQGSNPGLPHSRQKL